MKRKKSLIISLCMMLIFCSGCITSKPKESEGKPKATELELVAQKDTFLVNETYNLLWTFLPTGSEYEDIEFKSSDPTIVSVDENGKLRMLRRGTVTITGTSSSGLTDSVEIHVTRPKVEKIVLEQPMADTSPANLDLYVGNTYQLKWNFEPYNSDWPEIVWKSEDETIATVSDTGLITALEEGNVKIVGNYKIDEIDHEVIINVEIAIKRREYVNFVNRVIKPNTSLVFRHPYYYDSIFRMNDTVKFNYYSLFSEELENDLDTSGSVTVTSQQMGESVERTAFFTLPGLYEIRVDYDGYDSISCYVLVTEFELPETLTMEVGDTYVLLPPENLNTAGERFSLSLNTYDSKIVNLNNDSIYYGADGKIMALKPGVVTLSLHANLIDEFVVIDSCVVTVKEKEIETEIIPEEEKKEEATKPDTKPKPTPRPDPDDDYDPTPTPKPEVKVVEILGVPEYVVFDKEIVLDDRVKVSPDNATYKKIEWSLVDVNQTYLKLSVDEDGKTILEGTTGGSSSKVKAKITNGLLNEDFTQEFTINVLYDIDLEHYNNIYKRKQNEDLVIDLKAINGAGGPYTFKLKEGDKLPDDIELVIDENDENKLSAQLKGSASQVGEHSFTITVTDKDGNIKDFDFKLIVEAEENKELDVTLTPSSLDDAMINEVYSVILSASGYEGELTFEEHDSELLAAGLNLNSNGNNTATLTGTPTTAGTYTFTIRVSDKSGSEKDFEYILVVKEEATDSPENEIPTS